LIEIDRLSFNDQPSVSQLSSEQEQVQPYIEMSITMGRWVNGGNDFLLQPRNRGEMGRDDQFSLL